MNCWKNLLLSLLLLTSVSAFSQIKFRSTSTVGGASLNRGTEFEYIVQANGNSNNTTRQLLFDIQYDLTNFELVSVNHTGTGGNGGILPQNSNINLSYYDYNGYSFVTNVSGTTANNTTNGTTNYQYANYIYDQNLSSSILRITLTWAGTTAMPYTSYDRMIVVKLRLKAASTAFTFNPIKLNFVAGWTSDGQFDNTIMETPLSTTVVMNQNYGKYVTAKVDVNSNLYNISALKVLFLDTLAKTGQLFNVSSTGAVDINQSLLSANKVYDVSVMYNMDKKYDIYNSAITISDFTSAQKEFTQNGLGLSGDFGNVLNTGQSLYASDINGNQQIDAGDLPPLLAQVAAIDTLFKLPSTYSFGSGGYMSMPTWESTEITTIGGEVEWCYVSPNGYATDISRLYVDMRKIPTGASANQYNSIQLFDVYTGPIEYVSEDGTWAIYKVPSSLSKLRDGTSTYTAYTRQNGGDYSLRAEFTFNKSVNSSWSSISKTNWKTITDPGVYFKTGTLGTNAILDLKYLLQGDVNRSHSSQVITASAGASTIQSNALPSLKMNVAFNESASTGPYINTLYAAKFIDVNLTNMTVVSNNIEIPVSIDTKGNKVSGLQLEFNYDATKIKFDEMATAVPNGWYIFANTREGVVKFGALDQNKQETITGVSTPFKLKFSTIGEGVNVITSIKVSPTMDASDANGSQLGINLNTTQIKLTGYNNF